MYESDQLVGRDLGITLIAGCLPFFAQTGLVFYFFVVLKFLQKLGSVVSSDRNTLLVYQLTYLRSVSLIIPPLSLFCTFLPSIGIAYPEYQNIFIQVYLIGNGCIAWLYGILTSLSLRYLLYELNNHVKNF